VKAGDFEDSRKLKHPEGNENPAEPKFPNDEKVATKDVLGASTLSPGLARRFKPFEEVTGRAVAPGIPAPSLAQNQGCR
jgi:hypothetical protein